MTGSGVVLESLGGTYHVRLDDGTLVTASLRGRLKKETRSGDRVVAGDRVRLAPADEASRSGDDREGWTIEELLPRKSELVRTGSRDRKPRLVAANVDRLAAVLSAVHPAFPPETADRFLVLAELCSLDPVLIVTKMDLPGASALSDDIRRRYAAAGYPLHFTSIVTGEGLPAVRSLLSDGITILAGPSGVGKSSLLNALAPDLDLRTGAVSDRAGRGRHTTVSARLLEMPQGGCVVDTPGFSDVEFREEEANELPGAFPELAAFASDCRFRGCSHVHEPQCAVKEALERGDIDPDRYGSYLALRQSADS